MSDIDNKLDRLSVLLDSTRVLVDEIEEENPLIDVYALVESRLRYPSDELYTNQVYH